MDRPLRIALLTYRGHPEVGGQGVYVRQLSDALVAAGQDVTVFSGQPYPDLGPGVDLCPVPSLDLYRPDDPFRRPARREFRGPLDYYEYLAMCLGTFPEPLTFSLRVARALGERRGEFDVVHDNQGLGYGLLRVARSFPTLATIHHPISVDRRLALAQAEGRAARSGRRRWYSFVRMQARVARRLPRVIAVSEAARDDVVVDFRVPPRKLTVVHNGVDAELFRPLDGVARERGRILTIASSDMASKGLEHLVEAVAKLRTEREVELVVIGRGGKGAAFEGAVERFGVQGSVTALGRVDGLRLVDEMARAQVAVVPSLYEGFSLPAVEAMSCGVPLIATTGGALKEVVGDAGLLVPPADAGAIAVAVARVMDDPSLAASLSERGRARVLERFTWRVAAEAVIEEYRRVMSGC